MLDYVLLDAYRQHMFSSMYSFTVLLLFVLVVLSSCYCWCIFILLLFCFYSVLFCLSLLTLPASEHSWVILTTLACMSRFRARRWIRRRSRSDALSEDRSDRSGRLPRGLCEDSASPSILRSDVRIVYSALLFCNTFVITLLYPSDVILM